MHSLEERQQEADQILRERGCILTQGWNDNTRGFDYPDRAKDTMLVSGHVEIDNSVMHIYRFQETVVLQKSMQSERDAINQEQEQHEPFDGAAGDESLPRRTE